MVTPDLQISHSNIKAIADVFVRGTGLLTNCQAEIIMSKELMIVTEVNYITIRIITEIVGL